MRDNYAARIVLLGCVALIGAGFSGCGGSEEKPLSQENIKATQQLDQDRIKNTEEQYKNKKSTPAP